MSVDLTTPQAQAARIFMEDKGLGDQEPVEVEKVDGDTCWYFIYELDEGDLELEVSWTFESGWECFVTAFHLVDA